ncbi:hypothetical protein [Telluribacter sp.]|jgi:hypothetical protein|uniref:hypothetical protein n=1 Tax=Telluribacter sp. TaxID=1978767 RepID=UPI002E0D2511|nr:hypothetical protein [Telluribacter sp.]
MSKYYNPFGHIECTEYCDNKAKFIVFKDKRSKSEYRIENVSHHYLIRIKVDDCLIKEQDKIKKCDYLLLDCSYKKAFFIELKGQNLKDAIIQIKSTILELNSKLLTFSFCCRIVQSKVIKATQQQEKEELIRFLRGKYPLNIKAVKDLVLIGSQKLIEQI